MGALRKVSSLWLARVLAIAYFLFISVFSFDVFSGTDPIYMKLLGFLIHMLPALVLLAAVIVFWKRPGYSGIAFMVLGVAFTIMFHTYEASLNFLIVSLPLFVIAALYLLNSNPSGFKGRSKHSSR